MTTDDAPPPPLHHRGPAAATAADRAARPEESEHDHESVDRRPDDVIRADVPDPGPDAGPPPLVKSVAKAARILRCFDPCTSTLTVRDIARRTGYPRSTCHAICSTLAAEKLLELKEGGGYVLGVELLVMGGQVIERSGLMDAAVPSMNGLAAATGSEVHLGRLDDAWIVYLHRIRATRRVGADTRFGLRFPAHLTGCGRAAMSEMDVGQARRIAVSGGVAPDAADRLMDELHHARARGFVISAGHGTGFASVAAAVTGHDGRVVGGLSLGDRRETFGPRRVAAFGAAVREAADSISRRLARRPAPSSKPGVPGPSSRSGHPS